MKKLEIIGNNSIFNNILSSLEANEIRVNYTKLENVHGVGKNGQKWGNHIWPEENFILIIYEQDDVIKKIVDVIKKIKKEFSQEGIKIYLSSAEEVK